MPSSLTFTKIIAAPPQAVFNAFLDIDNIPKRIPKIVKVERLTPDPVGVGTKFKETRVMFGRESAETFEVTELDPPGKFVMAALSCGMEFRAEYHFHAEGTGTRMELTMHMRPVTFFAKLMSPLGKLMTGSMKKAIEEDHDCFAKSVEAEQTPA